MYAAILDRSTIEGQILAFGRTRQEALRRALQYTNSIDVYVVECTRREYEFALANKGHDRARYAGYYETIARPTHLKLVESWWEDDWEHPPMYYLMRRR